jgi:hypothetical protein
MKVQVWEFRLYYNIFDVIFNKYKKIKETYIPELNHSFNIYEGNINIIKCDKKRYNNKNIFYEKIRTHLIKEYEMNSKEEQMYKNLVYKLYKKNI